MLKCAVCQVVDSKETKILSCSSCKSVGYCSINHQKQDWPNHKKSCSFIAVKIVKVEIESDDDSDEDEEEYEKVKEYKTFALASRDFEQGEIVLDERPLFSVPFFHCCVRKDWSFNDPADFFKIMSGKIEVVKQDLQCLTCGVIVGPYQKCSRCSAPICSIGCQKAAVHAENECLAFSSASGFCPLEFGEHDDGAEYCPMRRVIIIRIEEAKKNQPEVWEAVKSLVQTNREFEDDYEMLLWLLDRQAFLHLDPSVPGVNDEKTGSFARLECLYKIGGQIEHSCAPNCTMALGNFPDFKMRVRAAVPIKKGEILNISRLPRHPDGIEGTKFRRLSCLSPYLGLCECDLCSDVTERGTFMSAVTCPNCWDCPNQNKEGKKAKKGGEKAESEGKAFRYCLPRSSDFDASWVCRACGMEAREIDSTTELFRFMSNFAEFNYFVDPKSHKFLHPNHFLIQKGARKYLTNMISQGKTMHDKFFKALKYLLEIEEKISPGLSPYRAELERRLSFSLLEVLLETRLHWRMSAEEINKLLKMVKECDKYQKRALLFYQNHPPERGDKIYRVAVLLKQEIELLKMIDWKIKPLYNVCM